MVNDPVGYRNPLANPPCLASAIVARPTKSDQVGFHPRGPIGRRGTLALVRLLPTSRLASVPGWRKTRIAPLCQHRAMVRSSIGGIRRTLAHVDCFRVADGPDGGRLQAAAVPARG